jgi:phosphoribosylformimino-5-aminoimidazole carboxamide ribotide isomerase
VRIIPVLDIAGGRAVHARSGDRAVYPAVRSVVADTVGDALSLARAYAAAGAREIYVADLDAICGREPQRALLNELAAAVPTLLVDAASADVGSTRVTIDAGAARVVVGLETLRSFDDRDEIVAEIGSGRVVFSLDLRDGAPIMHPRLAAASRHSPLALAERAALAGVAALIALDLARVGTGAGVDVAFIGQLRRALPSIELLAGGGVRDQADLVRLAGAGCDGALVGTAVHEGRVRIGETPEVRPGSA